MRKILAHLRRLFFLILAWLLVVFDTLPRTIASEDGAA